MKKGEHIKNLIGTGHGQATCQGAALEYITNIHSDLVKRDLRDQAKIMWMFNESALSDLGVGGAYAKKHGYIMKIGVFFKIAICRTRDLLSNPNGCKKKSRKRKSMLGEL